LSSRVTLSKTRCEWSKRAPVANSTCTFKICLRARQKCYS